MGFLNVAELNALRGIIRDAKEKWARVGLRPYQFGGNADRTFNGNYLEEAFIPGLVSIPEVNNPGLPTPLLTGPGIEGVRYRRRTWRGGVRYLWEDTIGDRIGYYRRLASGLSDALQYSLEYLYHEPFFRAVDPTYLGGWDNQPLLSANHQLLGGGTWNNRYTFVAPTDNVLRTIEEAMDTLPDPYGRPYAVNRIMIFTSTSLLRTFEQILNARSAISNPYASGQLNPNANIPPAFTAGRFTVVGSPYLNRINNGNVYFALGDGHKLFVAKAFARERMFELDNPPAYQHEVWWSGNVGWTSADRVIGFI